MKSRRSLLHEASNSKRRPLRQEPYVCKYLTRLIWVPHDEWETKKDQWAEEVVDILLEGLHAKFTHNENLKIRLIRSEDRFILEGCGEKCDCQCGTSAGMDDPLVTRAHYKENLLGKALMVLRARYQAEENGVEFAMPSVDAVLNAFDGRLSAWGDSADPRTGHGYCGFCPKCLDWVDAAPDQWLADQGGDDDQGFVISDDNDESDIGDDGPPAPGHQSDPPRSDTPPRDRSSSRQPDDHS